MIRVSKSLVILVLALGVPLLSADLSPQLASIDAQRRSIEQQMQSTQTQVASAQRQYLSVKRQAELVPAWKTPPPALVSALPLYDCQPISAHEAEPIIQSAADHEALPPELLRAVIKQESGFKPCAVSSMGAQGLMQLMPDTALDLRVNNPFDPKENIRGGASYLKQLVNRYGGDLRMALSAYNAGMGRVDRTAGVPDILETQNYVSSITGDLGYEQLPLLAGTWDAPGALDLPAETVVGNQPIGGHDFHPASLQLSLGSIQFGNANDKMIAVHLASEK